MKTNRWLVVVALAGVAWAFSGCASVVRGSSEKLIIQSFPSGAAVKLSTGQSGVTPFEVEVKRKDTIFVTVNKPGWQEANTAVISSIDGGSLGLGTAANLIFLPVVNDIVDYKTGANFSHKPNPLMVTLLPVAPVVPGETVAVVPSKSAPIAAPAEKP